MWLYYLVNIARKTYIKINNACIDNFMDVRRMNRKPECIIYWMMS